MQIRFWALCGMVAPLVYGAAVCLGGMLSPHYSPMSQAVSDLIATGAPNKALLDILFALYNVLSLCFASALYYQVHTTTMPVPKRIGEIGAGVLFAQGIFGLATLCFPEPAGGMSAAMTHTGKMHIVFAGLSSLTTMLSILLMGFWFNKNQHLRRYAVYSFFSVAKNLEVFSDDTLSNWYDGLYKKKEAKYFFGLMKSLANN